METNLNSKPINIIFSGTRYNDLLGNGLFQIIFYTFNGHHVNLLTSHHLSDQLKKDLIEHSIAYDIKLTFTNLYKGQGKGFVYNLRSLYQKLKYFIWRLKVFIWPYRSKIRYLIHKIYMFKHKIYLYRKNINRKMLELIRNLKRKTSIKGRISNELTNIIKIITSCPGDIPNYIFLFFLSISLKFCEILFNLFIKVSIITKKILSIINTVFDNFSKIFLKSLGNFMYIFARRDFTSEAIDHLNNSFICINAIDQSLIPSKYKKKSTLIIADFLSFDFPDDHDEYRDTYLKNLFAKEAKESRNIICFSKHVKDRHLVRGLGIDANKIIIIPHTLHDLSSGYNADIFDNKSMTNKAIFIIQKSKAFSKREKKRIIRSKFFLSASTYRKPYKGINTLLLFNEILRTKPTNFFIVSTHIPDENKKLFKDNGGIVPDKRVNNSELSALYVLSYASIHVSKFEGGINVAPFSEAVSVGKPCIYLSNLATEEANLNKLELGEIKDKARQNIFFNNYSSLDKTLLYLITNYQTVLDNQKKYFIDYCKSYNESDRNKLWEGALNRRN